MNRVGIDLRATQPGFKAHFGRGTGRYAMEVSERLFASQTSDVALHGIDGRELLGRRAAQLFLKLTPVGKTTLETQFLLPRRLKALELDLIHFFAHGDAPARLGQPYVVTVLDLIPLRLPDLYRAKKATWRFKLARFLELEAIRHAEGILAISECTKRDLVEILGVRPESVTVTPLGVDPRFIHREMNSESIRATLNKLGLPQSRPVISYVGGIDPRKNVPFLLEAFSELLKKFPGAGRPLLVLAGRYETEREYPDLLEQIRKLSLTDDVRLVNYLPDEKLIALYHVSTVVAFPSLYEGFGLPVLEAMACGCPVVAGRNSSIPEVAGDAALLVEDGARAAWVDALHRVITAAGETEKMRQAGLIQAKKFSWEDTASKTLGAYRQLLGLSAISREEEPRRVSAGHVTSRS